MKVFKSNSWQPHEIYTVLSVCSLGPFTVLVRVWATERDVSYLFSILMNVGNYK